MKGKRIIIMGASSGIGKALAELCIKEGYTLGVCARREQALEELKQLAPERVFVKAIDICKADATEKLDTLIQEMGGLDIYVHSSGMGFQNPDLDESKDLQTVELNTLAFTKLASWVFRYFEKQASGHLLGISSIAGTRGLGAAASYSASKAYQATFLQSLRQLKAIKGLKEVHITDIRPGFVATPLLKDDKYIMLMQAEDVAKELFKSIKQRKTIRIIDWRYRLVVGLWRLIPRFLWERLPLKSK